MVAVTPFLMSVAIRSCIFAANPSMLPIDNGRINVARRVRHVRRRSHITVRVRTSVNMSVRWTSTHAHSDNYLSIRLRRSDKRHR